MRPVRRASTIARAGSPRRAGSVADISTPTIVAEVTSRRRSGLRGSAARAIEYQELARRNIEAIISAGRDQRPRWRRSGRCWSTTRSTPIRRAAMKVSPTPTSGGDAERRPGARSGGGRALRAGSGRARAAAAPGRGGGRRPARARARRATRVAGRSRLGDRDRALVDAPRPRRRPAARRSARADSRAASPIAREPLAGPAQRLQLLGQPLRVGGRDEDRRRRRR